MFFKRKGNRYICRPFLASSTGFLIPFLGFILLVFMSGVIIVFIAVLRLKLMNVIPIFVLFFIIFFQIAYILLRNMLKTILIYPEKSTLYIKGNGTGGGFPFDEIKEIVITKEEKGTGTSTRIFYIVSLNTLTKGMKKVFSDRSSSSAHAFAEELSQIISKEVKTLSD